MILLLVAHWVGVCFWKPLGKSLFHARQLRLICEVGEFVGVGLVIVKLLITVGVADVTVALTPRGVVALAPSGDGGSIPFGLRIL